MVASSMLLPFTPLANNIRFSFSVLGNFVRVLRETTENTISHHPDHRQVLRWATTKRINSYLLRTHPRQHDDARYVLRATTSTTLMEPMETITLECNTSKTPNTSNPFFKVTLTARSHTHIEHIQTYVSCNCKVHIVKHPHVQRSANCAESHHDSS